MPIIVSESNLSRRNNSFFCREFGAKTIFEETENISHQKCEKRAALSCGHSDPQCEPAESIERLPERARKSATRTRLARWGPPRLHRQSAPRSSPAPSSLRRFLFSLPLDPCPTIPRTFAFNLRDPRPCPKNLKRFVCFASFVCDILSV